MSAAEAAIALINGGAIEEKTKIEDVLTAPIEKMSITRSDRTRAYVKIEDGCDNHCTYCIIKTARGNVVSRSADEIIDEINRLCVTGYEEAVLTGVETRTSAPVRILRGEDMRALGKGRIYPCGEGAGYAGGITSASVDGIRVALSIMERFKPRG